MLCPFHPEATFALVAPLLAVGDEIQMWEGEVRFVFHPVQIMPKKADEYVPCRCRD